MILKKWDQLPSEMRTEEVRRYYDILKRKKTSLFFKRIFDIFVLSSFSNIFRVIIISIM